MKYLLDTDHISFLQKRRGPEYAALIARITQHSSADFAFSIVSFHEQVLGGHALLNRARTTAHLIRGYAFLLEILQSYTTTPSYRSTPRRQPSTTGYKPSEFAWARWISESRPSRCPKGLLCSRATCAILAGCPA